jgi:hypothetical protein
MHRGVRNFLDMMPLFDYGLNPYKMSIIEYEWCSSSNILIDNYVTNFDFTCTLRNYQAHDSLTVTTINF